MLKKKVLTSNTLFLDFETYSPVDLKKSGAVAYCQHPKFMVLCAAINGAQVKRDIIVSRLKKPSLIIAHNASFEREVLKAIKIDVEKHTFVCTAVYSRMVGGPSSLKDCAEYFELENKKDDAGLYYIKYFNKKLQETTISKLMNTEEGLEMCNKLILYCVQDTIVLKELFTTLNLKLSIISNQLRTEIEHYNDSLRINDNGIPIDLEYKNNLLKIYNEFKPKAEAEFFEKYGFNPRSSKQVLTWLGNHKIVSSEKSIIKKNWRLLTSKQQEMFLDKWLLMSPQVKRLEKIDGALVDGRLKGFLIHFGTNTGRYTSKIINLLNFPKGFSQEAIDDKNFIETHKKQTGQKMLETLRGIIAPEKGSVLICSDLRQIEFRLLMWYLKYDDILEDLEDGNDIYLDFAETIYNKRPEKDSIERQTAKAMILSLGYGASVNSAHLLISKIINNPDIKILKKAYRAYHKQFPKVKKLALAFERSMRQGKTSFKLPNGHVRFFEPKHVYGSLLVARFFQSMARELLFEKQHELMLLGYKIVFNVYDEIVVEVKKADIEQSKGVIRHVMETPVPWLKGLPIETEISVVNRYGGKSI